VCDNLHEGVHEIEQKFVSHMAEHGLSYATSEEYQFRLNLFMESDAELKKINAQEGNTFVVDHNMFSTMTESEKKRMFGRLPATQKPEGVEYENNTTLEAAVDWRSKGAVNAVQNQGSCGSCWAFSTTAAMEGNHKIKSGKLLKLAESQLVDCDTGDGGCNGGLEWNAMKYLKTHPQELESDYPYAPRNRRCAYSSAKGKVKVTAINYITNKSISAMKASISTGPTCVGVNASDRRFNGYSGGILNVSNCSPNQDHAVTAVGFGAASGKNFFIVRNSWGRSWGESGYIRMSADVGGAGVCGVLIDATRPTTS
jgi:cathepsin L